MDRRAIEGFLEHQGYVLSEDCEARAIVEGLANELAMAMGVAPPHIVFVTSIHRRVHTLNFGGIPVIVWDTGFISSIVELLSGSVLGLSDLSALYQVTDGVMTNFLTDLATAAGYLDGAKALNAELRDSDWDRAIIIWAERHLGPMLWALSPRAFAEITSALRLSAANEISRLMFRSVNPTAAVSIVEIQLTSIAAHILAHELAHYTFVTDVDLKERYIKEVQTALEIEELAVQLCMETPLERFFPSYFGFSATDTGYEPDEDANQAISFTVIQKHFKRPKSPELLEEICCDWFAIDAVWRYQLVTRGVSPLALAEFEQALAISHQYLMWLGFLRYDMYQLIRGELGPSALKGLDDQHARGVFKLLRAMQHKRKLSSELQEALPAHRDAISWLDLLVQAQIFVLARVASQAEVILPVLTGKSLPLEMVVPAVLDWIFGRSHRIADLHWFCSRSDPTIGPQTCIEGLPPRSGDMPLADWLGQLSGNILALSDHELAPLLPTGISLQDALNGLQQATDGMLNEWSWWDRPIRCPYPIARDPDTIILIDSAPPHWGLSIVEKALRG